MMTNNLLKKISLCLMLAVSCLACSKDDDENNSSPTPEITAPANSKFLVSAEVGDAGYYMTTDNITEGAISIIGNGREGYANLGASVDGYFYVFGDGTLDKYEFTDNGMVLEASISIEALIPGSFYRYIKHTGDGELFLSNFPNDDGEVPYAIIDLETFTATSFGFLAFPEVDGYNALWSEPLVNGSSVYFGTLYGTPKWDELANSLITIKFDYPSMTNPVVLKSNASKGQTGGYRTNATIATENGDLYQHNLSSVHWSGTQDPTVITRIRNGEYDDSYVFDISAEYNEHVAIWNMWYAGNDIAYANIIKDSDILAWADLSGNTGKLVEINLATKTLTELNIPSAPFVNLFKAECVHDGKFYIPVSIAGGEANIYEITIGGGANGFTKGASLDGSNVYINALYRNF